ncbi:MAG TPA: hypothetical protein VN181_00240 [Thermoanaerobaculia bacterium]|nr:hypothetical protein [Thermoanaerobaculia bacterium]
MRKTVVVITFVVVAFSIARTHAQSADGLHKSLTTESAKLKMWASDPAILSATKAQNARKVALAEVQRLDREWIEGKAHDLMKQVTTGPCADRLRKLAAENAAYGEAFVSDDQGALVCASQETSDYWQGDEAKFIRAYDGGRGSVFIDRPRLDASAKAHLAQISLPIMDGGKAIGTITVGVDTTKLK